jgi:hypothetical protein
MGSKVLSIAALAMTLLMAASPACAQNMGVEEIVVTGSRLKTFDANETPFVVLRKRADNLITRVTVVCDTREPSLRRAELKATLKNLIKAAQQDKAIALGVGDEIVGVFDDTMLDTVIEPDAKADTSRATVVIKTAVSAGDSFDAATGRIKAFVARTPKVGRTEVLFRHDWELTLVAPGQYRPEVARLVAEDARRMATVFGEGYGVEVQGLQLPVSWYQAGPLDLALYIPYRLTIRPVRP